MLSKQWLYCIFWDHQNAVQAMTILYLLRPSKCFPSNDHSVSFKTIKMLSKQCPFCSFWDHQNVVQAMTILFLLRPSNFWGYRWEGVWNDSINSNWNFLRNIRGVLSIKSWCEPSCVGAQYENTLQSINISYEIKYLNIMGAQFKDHLNWSPMLLRSAS